MKTVKYQIIGYGMKHGKTQWEEFNNAAIVDCPEGVNPYLYIPASWSGLLDHWLVWFKEVKE